MENNVSYEPESPVSFPETTPNTPIAHRGLFVSLVIAGTYLLGILLTLFTVLSLTIVLNHARVETVVKQGFFQTGFLWLLGLTLVPFSIGATLSNLDEAIRRLGIATIRISFGSVVWALLAVSIGISAFNAFIGESTVGQAWEFLGSFSGKGGSSSAGHVCMGIFWTLIASIAAAMALIASMAKTLRCHSASHNSTTTSSAAGSSSEYKKFSRGLDSGGEMR